MAKERLTIAISSQNKKFLKRYAIANNKSMSACVRDWIDALERESKFGTEKILQEIFRNIKVK